MKSRPHLLLLWPLLLLFCCLSLSSAQCQNSQEILNFPFEELVVMAESDHKFYCLNLANAPKDLDLFISALPLQQEAFSPRLFVSQNKELPQNIEDADYSSVSISGNVVFINHQGLKDASDFLYIGLLCAASKCDARVLVEGTEETKTLKSETPVEMSLEESSFVYFQYLHEVESHLQIDLTRFSGQLKLYVISMNQDHTSNQIWQRTNTQNPQSVITIPIQDYRSCASCLYFIKIEAISSSNFSLIVNQFEEILPIETFSHYSRQLKSKKSAVYMLKSDGNTQEVQLNIEISEEKLIVLGSKSPQISLTENYLWKEEIVSENQIVLFNKSAQGDYDYILLHNPTENDIDFNFMITPQITPIDRIEQIYSVNRNQKKFFQYSATGPTDAYIIFYAALTEKAKRDFTQKLPGIQARSLPRRSNEESKEIIFQAESTSRAINNESYVIVQHKFSGKIPEGREKYLFEIANPWEFKVDFRLSIGPSSPSTKAVISQSEQFSDVFGIKSVEAFEVMIDKPGKWSLWVYSCDILVDFNVENGDLETGMMTILKGESYLYKETISKPEKRILNLKVNSHAEEVFGKFLMYSSLVNEKDFKNYDVKEDNLEVQVFSTSQKDDRSQVTVEFKPAEFKDANLSDEILYQVRLCSEQSQQFAEEQFCRTDYDCKDSEVRLSVKQKEIITVDFQRVKDGKYSVKIKATVIHQNQPVKFVQPYLMRFVDVKNKPYVEEKKLEQWKILMGMMALTLVLVAGGIGYKKFLNYLKGVVIQESGVRGFQVIEDEGVDPEETQVGKTEDSEY